MASFFSLSGVVIVATISITLIVLAVLGWRISVDKNGVQTSRDWKEFKKISPHARCANRTHGLNTCRKSYEFGYKRGVASFQTLSQQMSVYDEYEEEAISSLQKCFSDILISKLPEDAQFSMHREYRAFETLLSSIFSEISRMTRRWFKNNHYALKDATEQNDYVRRKKDLIIDNIGKMIDSWWIGEVVTRKDILGVYLADKEAWKNRIEYLFAQAFEIARTNAELKATAEKHYCAYIEETYGEEVKIVDDANVV
jgi:hypothetical protein